MQQSVMARFIDLLRDRLRALHSVSTSPARTLPFTHPSQTRAYLRLRDALRTQPGVTFLEQHMEAPTFVVGAQPASVEWLDWAPTGGAQEAAHSDEGENWGAKQTEKGGNARKVTGKGANEGQLEPAKCASGRDSTAQECSFEGLHSDCPPGSLVGPISFINPFRTPNEVRNPFTFHLISAVGVFLFPF